MPDPKPFSREAHVPLRHQHIEPVVTMETRTVAGRELAPLGIIAGRAIYTFTS
jgi:hypothetical protein